MLILALVGIELVDDEGVLAKLFTDPEAQSDSLLRSV